MAGDMTADWKPDWRELQEAARARDNVLEFAPAPVTDDLYPMGMRLRVETNDPAVLEAARQSFGRYPHPAVAGGAPDVTIRLLVHAVDDQAAPHERGRSVARLHENYFYVTVGRDAVVMGDMARGRVFGCIPPSLVLDPEFIRHHFIESGFYFVLRARGFVGMHGAGLERDGRSVMLRAWQGTGKSTLAYACVRRGYHLLGEDVVWVHWDSPRQEWWGAPWTLSLLPDSQDFFPEFAGAATTVMSNGEHKILLELDRIAPDAAVVTTPPGILVFLERHAAARSEAVSLTPSQAYNRFVHPLCEPAGPSTPGYTTAAEQLLSRPAYLLRLGANLDAAVDELDRLLESRA